MISPLALVIEDDRKLAKIFAYALQAARFETEIIQDGQTAQTRLTEVVPTVVVLDLHLPYVSGTELLRQIRVDERLKDTKVILATADAMLAHSLRNESDFVLLKPISPTRLRDLALGLRPQHGND